MRNAFIIFRHELKILLRDRQAIGLLLVMPMALIIFLTLALQDVYQAKVGRQMKLSVVTSEPCEDEKNLCNKLVSELKSQEFNIEVVPSTDQLAAKTEVAIVLPKKLSETLDQLVQGKKLKDDQVIELLADPILDQSSRRLVQGHLALAMQSLLIDQVKGQLKRARINASALDRVTELDGVIKEGALGGVILPNPIQQSVPAWALFGMFFIAIPLGNSFIRDRKFGVFKRLLSFPVSRAELMLGKISPFLIINIFQFAIMFLVGFLVLPKLTNLTLSWDFDLGGLFVVTLACAITATSYGLFVSCVTRTSEQAHAFASLSIVILAILGGVMIPRFVMPDFMQKISMASPLYWGLEAYLDLIVRKLPLSAVLMKIQALMAFACGFLLIATIRFKWNEGAE